MSEKTSDFSFGIIAVHKENGQHHFLLIQHKNKAKHRAFPKGHKEAGENDLVTAKREFEEETGISSTLLLMDGGRSEKTQYRFFAPWLKKNITKEVSYFVGYLDKKYPVTIQVDELLDYDWLNYEDALKRLSYDTDKVLLTSLVAFLAST